MKWTIIEKKYALRSITNKNLKVPEKPKLKCMGFIYNGAKLFNILPPQTREIKDPNTFKTGYGKTSLHISHKLICIYSLSSAVLQISLKNVLWIIANKL